LNLLNDLRCRKRNCHNADKHRKQQNERYEIAAPKTCAKRCDKCTDNRRNGKRQKRHEEQQHEKAHIKTHALRRKHHIRGTRGQNKKRHEKQVRAVKP
jgi:hypothetical protein